MRLTRHWASRCGTYGVQTVTGREGAHHPSIHYVLRRGAGEDNEPEEDADRRLYVAREEASSEDESAALW